MKLPVGVSLRLGRAGLKLKAHAPEILIGVGVIAIIGVAITAGRATLKVPDILEHHEAQIDQINNTDLDEGAKTVEYTKVYARTGRDFMWAYLPTITFGVLSVACFTGAHGIMKKRNVALMAAYKILETQYDDYRQRVRDKWGDDVDRDIRYSNAQARMTEEVVVTDGESGVESVSLKLKSPNEFSIYARFFDQTVSTWDPHPDYNRLFLQSQQSYWNQILQARGHVFLNEVYDSLGFDRTSAGAVVGWVLGKDEDNYIDFGLFNDSRPEVRMFINGTEEAILLDFNVSGTIYDKI